MAFKDGGVIHPGYNTEADELRDIVHGGKGYLATLEAKLTDPHAEDRLQPEGLVTHRR